MGTLARTHAHRLQAMVSSAAAGWGITDLRHSGDSTSLNIIVLFETFETQCMCTRSILRAVDGAADDTIVFCLQSSGTFTYVHTCAPRTETLIA